MEHNKAELSSDVGAVRDAGNAAQSSSEDGRKGAKGLSEDKGLRLDKWQEEILDCEKNVLLCTGRQVGKTTIFAIKAAKHMIAHPKTRIIVVSLTEDQAQLIIIMMLNYLEQNYKSWLKVPKKAKSQTITKNKILLNNGSQVLSRPVGNTGDAVRGFTGDILIIDEASRMPESVFVAAKPTLLTTGGKIWMCSTPFGKQGYFWESFQNKYDRWEVFHISSEEVIHNRPISETWTEKNREEGIRMLDEEKRDMGLLQYSQEYLGLFMEDLRRFFDDEWINQTCTISRSNLSSSHFHFLSKDYFLGLDIARMGDDLGTYEIIQRVSKDRLQQVENITTQKKLTTETFDRICDLEKQWKFRKIGIDAGSGSLGVGILDFLLREPIIRKKVIALNNKAIALDKDGKRKRMLLKEDMYSITKALGEKGVLKLLNDEDLIASFRNIQVEFVMKEGAKTQVKIFGRNAHIVEGIVRAVYLANQKHINTRIDYI